MSSNPMITGSISYSNGTYWYRIPLPLPHDYTFEVTSEAENPVSVHRIIANGFLHIWITPLHQPTEEDLDQAEDYFSE